MCEQCEVLNINGINCHERGCPDAWKDYDRDCKWCGSEFIPEDQDQEFCCEDCAINYNNTHTDQGDQNDA